ncbi:MAG: prepilin peptidase [Epsilonproteobacteria bacterium]|nr:prepilin peptidase [Campylobacterota bacterium]
MEYNIVVALFIFLFGVSVGSFLNVLIYRIPNEISIISPPSACPNCKNRLKWYHNIPIISWIFLGGKCAFCEQKISIKYPLVELINGIIWVLLYFKIGLVWYFPFVALSFSMLLALSIIDLKYYAVPDSLNYAALIFALINPNFLISLRDAAIGALGLFLVGYFTSKLAKKDALGEADIIVAATMAALLGFPAFFIAMFISAIVAIIPSLFAKDTMIPFVPFLSIGTLITYLYKEELLNLLEVLLYGQS